MRFRGLLILFLFSAALTAQTGEIFSGTGDTALSGENLLSGNEFPVMGFQYNIFPSEFYSGDTVHMFCSFVSSAGLIEAPFARGTEEEPFYEDHNLTVYTLTLEEQEGVYSLDLVFKAWHPGILSFPVFKAGPFEIQLPELNVCSIIEKESNPGIQPLRPPEFLPGTDYYIFALVILLFVFIIVAVALVIIGVRGLPYFVHRHTIKQRYRILRKILSKLEKQKEKIPVEEYYAVISRELRLFMERKFSLPVPSFCSDEVVKRLSAFDGLPLREIQEVFSSIDLIRYGRLPPDSVLANTEWGKYIKNKNNPKATMYILDLAQRMENSLLKEDVLS